MALRWLASALVACVALVASCGGGSSGNGAGGGSTTTVTLNFAGGTPTAVAAQIGPGAFTTETVSSNGLSLSLPSGTTTFAVAYVCNPPAVTLGGQQMIAPYESVVEASTADGTSFTLPCPFNFLGNGIGLSGSAGQTGSLAVNVNASGIPSATSVSAIAENGSSASGWGATTVTASGSFAAPVGSDRVEVFATASSSNFIGAVVAARAFANQAVPGSLNGGAAVVLGAADETTPEPITFQNVPTGFLPGLVTVTFNIGPVNYPLGSGTTQYSALPAIALESGDYYTLNAAAIRAVPSSGGPAFPQLAEVVVTTHSTSGGPMTFNLPAPWIYAGPTPDSWPTFDFSGYTGFAGQSGVYDTGSVDWTTNGGLDNYSVSVSASANYLHGATSLTVPDLPGLQGFLAPPSSGTQVFWTSQIIQNSGGFMQPAQPNSTVPSVLNSGGYNEP
jgi:hypothetical protein